MLIEYPVNLIQDENGTLIAEFPDVPEALTVGPNIEETLARAQDALMVALSVYLDEHREIPKPSEPQANQPTVSLPPLVTSKLAVYQAMRARNVSQAELAARLHCDARQVRRILDLDHQSKLDQIEEALRALDMKLVIDVRDLKAG